MASIVGKIVAEDEVIEPLDERALVESAKHDSAALAQLYRKHYSAIAGYVHRRVSDRNKANDIVSDVFLEMVRGIKRFPKRTPLAILSDSSELPLPNTPCPMTMKALTKDRSYVCY